MVDDAHKLPAPDVDQQLVQRMMRTLDAQLPHLYKQVHQIDPSQLPHVWVARALAWHLAQHLQKRGFTELQVRAEWGKLMGECLQNLERVKTQLALEQSAELAKDPRNVKRVIGN